jgi:hypothetical protein
VTSELISKQDIRQQRQKEIQKDMNFNNINLSFNVKVNLSVCLIEYHGRKTRGSENMIQAFLNLIVDGWKTSRPSRFISFEIAPY